VNIRQAFTQLALVCFALAFPSTASAQDVPQDFSVNYQWMNGSLRPPFHYAYQLSIRASNESAVVMVMGYPTVFDDITKWKEPLHPTQEQIKVLYDFIETNKLSPGVWTHNDGVPHPAPTGGQSCSIFIVARNLGYSVPCNSYDVDEEYLPKQQEFLKIIADFVPAATWAILNGKRDDYMSRTSGK